ncbi:zinc finger protein 692 isoform X3 [Sturnira hondurensis]|uniref:zinc finger protein 692 isoform X3 n=1 Tax=Sturnira hondurensis TaxID=192404 RepID=UPI00187A9848|nr:zinc finger protein 692 isoform X3 [Sturnira hondurensis]
MRQCAGAPHISSLSQVSSFSAEPGPRPRATEVALKGATAAAPEGGPGLPRLSPLGVAAPGAQAPGPWLPLPQTHRTGGGRSGGSWTRAAASVVSAWAATWNSGASSRSGWDSPCTRSSPSSCLTGTLLQAVCSVQPNVSSTLTPPMPTDLESEHEKRNLRTQEARVLRGMRPPPEFFLPPGEDKGGDEDESEEEMLSDASPWTYSSSSDNCEPDGPRLPPSPVTHALKEGEIALAPAAAPTSLAGPPSSAPAVSPGASLPVEGGVELEFNRIPQAAQQSEPLASPGSQAQSSLVVAWDKDSTQIGPKRIRKAAKKELLPCDFPGCGRIFSNRQYLNHHKKYQHIHQKSFSCPEPACGKSFNFKKHLKEHVKLHSDTRDYICEFCARSFRTSSNLVIHQRIHTGEKPLQCEICGFTCRQKASLNWHRRKHAETAATLRFPCEVCGKRFEKPDSVAAHCSKSHPAMLLATSEQLGQVEPCPSISVPTLLGSRDECRPPQILQALTLLPKQ